MRLVLRLELVVLGRVWSCSCCILEREREREKLIKTRVVLCECVFRLLACEQKLMVILEREREEEEGGK